MNSTVTKLRRDIDLIDRDILKLLSKRFKVTGKLQMVKKKLGMKLTQKEREQKLYESYISFAKEHKIPYQCVKTIFRAIFSYSKKSGIIK